MIQLRIYVRFFALASLATTASSWSHSLQSQRGVRYGARVRMNAASSRDEQFKALLVTAKTLHSNEVAQRLEELQPSNVEEYNMAIIAFGYSMDLEQAFSQLSEMRDRDITPNAYSYMAAISVAARLGQSRQSAYALAIRAAGDLEQIDIALALHAKILAEQKWSSRNLAVYKAAIGACAKIGMWEKALALMRDMQDAGLLPDRVCFQLAIKACGRGGKLQTALGLFDLMSKVGLKPEVGVCNSAIVACAREGAYEEALQVLEGMKFLGIPCNIGTINGIMHACGTAGLWDRTLTILNALPSWGIKPVHYTYNMVMAALGNAGQVDESFVMLDRMAAEGFPPTVESYISALIGCQKTGNWQSALLVLDQAKSRGVANTKIYAWTITIVANAAQLENAMYLFEEMRSAGIPPDTQCFTYVIAACANKFEPEWQRALQLLGEMRAKRIKRDQYTYMYVIRACARADQWQLALALLAEMRDMGLPPIEGAYDSVMMACRNADRMEVVEAISQGRMETPAISGKWPENFYFEAALEAATISKASERRAQRTSLPF